MLRNILRDTFVERWTVGCFGVENFMKVSIPKSQSRQPAYIFVQENIINVKNYNSKKTLASRIMRSPKFPNALSPHVFEFQWSLPLRFFILVTGWKQKHALFCQLILSILKTEKKKVGVRNCYIFSEARLAKFPLAKFLAFLGACRW